MHKPSPSPLRRCLLSSAAAEGVGGFFAGLLLAGTYVGSMTSPLPIAIATNLNALGAVTVLVGSLLSYSLSDALLQNLPLLFALVAVTCLRILKHPPKTAGHIAAGTGLLVFLSGLAVSLLTHASGAEVIGYTMTAGLTGCASFFLHAVFTDLRSSGKISLRETDGCAAAVVLILAIAALSCYQIPAMNAGAVISTALTLLAARKFRCSGGVICGALTVCGACLGAPEAGLPLLILPAAGLLVGTLAKYNRFACAALFFLFAVTGLITFGSALFSLSTVISLFLGSTLFLFLDGIHLERWLVTDWSPRQAPSQPVSARLRHMADAIHMVREDAGEIAALLPQKALPCDITRQVCETVCGSCRHKLRCWESDYEATLAGFRRMEQHTAASAPPIPEELSHCSRMERLQALFSHHAAEARKAQFLAARTAESRTLLLEQLAAAEELLQAAGDHANIRYSEELSETVQRRLQHYGYPCRHAAVFYTPADRMMLELHCEPHALDGCLPAVRHILSEALNLTLEELDPLSDRNSMRYRLCQRPKYRLEQYTSAFHAQQESVSGDTAISFTDSVGNPCLVLSDGMGTGKHAAVESHMATELFRKFLSGGISGTAAVRMMNGILLTKSPEESFATLDVAQFDLDAGILTILKSGAAATLIRHKGTVSRISAQTFPLGLEPEGESAVRQVQLNPDDVILMLTDGISEDSYPFIRQLLESSDDLEQIVREICEKAVIFAGGCRRDDVTVCAARLLPA